MTISRRSMARTAAVAAAATSVLTLAVTPASAFSQSWGSGSYHASGDFVPSSGTIRIGGQGCTGAARTFYVQLVKTSGSSKVFSSYSYGADGQSHTDPRGIGVSTSTSYYLRWYGKDNGGKDASAPCATAYTA
ncbi:hypothetical protein ACWC5I_14815 [Kitasatospora sp. NPDC001574]